MAKTNVTVEVFYIGSGDPVTGSWHDITADVYVRDGITITRGRPDESQRIPPSTLSLSIDNRDGSYSPRNPVSALYGLIGRNTPIRVSADGSYRFHGEVESWPQRWSVEGNDVWTPITANGILRRLNAPGTTKPALSAMRRAVLTSVTQPFAYWPMETNTDNDTGADQTLLSPITGVEAMEQQTVGASFGKGFAGPGAAGVPDFRTGGILSAVVPDDGLFNGTTGYTVEFVARYDNNPSAAGGLAIRWHTPGAQPSFWELSPGPSMDLFFGAQGLFQGSAGGVVDAYDGLSHHHRVTVQQSGANIIINLYRDGVLMDIGDDFGGGNPVVTGTVNRPSLVYVSQGNAGAPTDEAPTGIGHVTFWHGVTPPADTVAAATAHVDETAADRMTRLCAEEGIAFTVLGDGTLTEAVGVQRVAPFLELLNDAAEADGGILFEDRSSLGLVYRTHYSLYSQSSTVDLSYSAGDEVAPPLEPVEDTDVTGNDITVTRYQGGSARVVQETGTLNVQEPPEGIGRFKRDLTLVLAGDGQLLPQAAWIKHLGTWDEARYPVVNLDLTAMDVAGKSSLVGDVVALDVGDRFRITNPPSWLPPDSIEQHAQGFSEDIGSHRWAIAVNATPAGPYDVFELETSTDDNLSRIPAADGATTTSEALDATETGVDIISTRVRWIDSATYSAQFPFDVVISGERMTVSALTTTAATFVAAGVAAHTNNASATPGLPAGVQSGDLLLIFAAVRNTADGVPQTPSGYTRLPVFESTDQVQLFAKVHSGSESNPTVAGTDVVNADLSAQMCAFRNMPATLLDDLADIVVDSTAQLNGSAQDIAYFPLSPQIAGCVVLALGWKQDDWTSVATLSGFTEIGEPSTTLGSDQGLVWDYQIQTTQTDAPGSSFVVTGGTAQISRSALVALAGGYQTMTVARSINGVVKSHSAGTAIQLFRPPVIAR